MELEGGDSVSDGIIKWEPPITVVSRLWVKCKMQHLWNKYYTDPYFKRPINCQVGGLHMSKYSILKQDTETQSAPQIQVSLDKNVEWMEHKQY